MTIISIGELLWDVFPGGEHLGGASFNFAAHAARLGHKVIFLSAVGDDDRGKRALAEAAELGLSTRYVHTIKNGPTGTVTVAVDAAGQPSFTIHRPAAYDLLSLTEEELHELASENADWLYFGTLYQSQPQGRTLTERLIAACPGSRRFYDVNLRPNSYTPDLVLSLLSRANVVKINDAEVATLQQVFGWLDHGLEGFCRSGRQQFGWDASCVTRGAEGCALQIGERYMEGAGYPVKVVDTVGAGDAFAAAFLHGLGMGWAPGTIGDFANRLGALIASREGAVPSWTMEECHRLERAAT